MKKIKLSFSFGLILFSLLLSGCASNSSLVWEHPQQLDQTQLALDKEECSKIALRVMQDLWPRPASMLFNHQRHHPRLWLSEPMIDYRQIRQEQVYRACMDSKGWQLVRKLNPTENSENTQ
jgi:hypothetical protein